MVTKKQRQRDLARAKWERQQARRHNRLRRTRTSGLVGGVVVGLLVLGLVIWLVVALSGGDSSGAAPRPDGVPDPAALSGPAPATEWGSDLRKGWTSS